MRIRLLAATVGAVVGLGLWSTAASAGGSWACKVVLCLSNPGGPTQYGACVPPIERLWRSLALGHGMPVCSAGGVTAAVEPVPDPYVCPQGATLQQDASGPAVCMYPDPEHRGTWMLPAIANPYGEEVNIRSTTGDETVWIDGTDHRVSLRPPARPPVTAAMLAQGTLIPNNPVWNPSDGD